MYHWRVLPDPPPEGRELGRFTRRARAAGGRRPVVVVQLGDTRVIDRHCQVAAVLDVFHRRLLAESKETAYPTAELELALRMSVKGAR